MPPKHNQPGANSRKRSLGSNEDHDRPKKRAKTKTAVRSSKLGKEKRTIFLMDLSLDVLTMV
jgi:hypothetical protein